MTCTSNATKPFPRTGYSTPLISPFFFCYSSSIVLPIIFKDFFNFSVVQGFILYFQILHYKCFWIMDFKFQEITTFGFIEVKTVFQDDDCVTMRIIYYCLNFLLKLST